VKTTFATLVDQFDTRTQFHTDFAADLDIPVLDGPQCQGDVSVCPANLLPNGARLGRDSVPVTVTAAGVEVIRGGAMNNAHTLRSIDAGVTWTPADVREDSVILGLLTVPAGAQCFLEHPEHGFNGIGAGTFVIGRQREQADVIRMVQD